MASEQLDRINRVVQALRVLDPADRRPLAQKRAEIEAVLPEVRAAVASGQYGPSPPRPPFEWWPRAPFEWRTHLRDEQGQDLIEYTLLLAFVALASAALFIGAGNSVKGIWSVTNSQLSAANQSAS